MKIVERSIVLDDLSNLRMLGTNWWHTHDGEVLIRFVVEKIVDGKLHCSINTIKGCGSSVVDAITASTEAQRQLRYDDKFRVALVIPTGLGASVGGHAGDGGATARLMSSVCDQLVTHPNVVNASDINEMTDNTLYVEGYSLIRPLAKVKVTGR